MTVSREKAALYIMLILILCSILMKYGEQGNAFSFREPSASSISTLYHPGHRMNCPPPPFEC